MKIAFAPKVREQFLILFDAVVSESKTCVQNARTTRL